MPKSIEDRVKPSWSLTITKGKRKYILISTDDSLWPMELFNEHDEGMGMSEIILFDLLDKHFKEEF